MLVPNQWAGKHNCTRQSDIYVTVAPDQKPCLYNLLTISMQWCMSVTILFLSASMHITFAADHQPCLKQSLNYQGLIIDRSPVY